MVGARSRVAVVLTVFAVVLSLNAVVPNTVARSEVQTTVIGAGTVDAARAVAPKWTNTNFVAPATAEMTITLSWTGDADLRFSLKTSDRVLLTRNITAGAGPKTIVYDLVEGTAYRLGVWSISGVGVFTLELSYDDGVTDPTTTTTTTTPPPTNSEPPDPGDRPNIVIVNTDDQRADTLQYLETIQAQLGERGTTYTNAYISTPSCCPSRATLMSGQYVHNNGQFGQLVLGFDVTLTIQRYLQDAGYYTGHAGKFLHWWALSDGVAPYFDRWTYFKGGYENVWMNFDGATRQSNGYSTEIVFDRAIEYLEDFAARDDDTPWYLHLTPIAPHSPYIPEAQYVNAPVPPYEPTPNVFEEDQSDKFRIVRNNNSTPESIADMREQMIRTLYTVDDEVGRLIDYLEATGEMRNTLFIFTSDNGYAWAEHGLRGKFTPYPISVGVPMVVRWDGHVAEGQIDDGLVTHVDLGPTVLTAAGIDLGDLIEPMDGHDMLGGYERTVGLTEYWQDDRNNPNVPDWASIHTATYQYIEWYTLADPSVVEFREYYDMVADPWQLTNLLADGDPMNDPDYGPLSAQLAAARVCAGPQCE